MHATRLLSAAVLVLTLALPAFGQTPYPATIVAPEVDVRSGPSLQLYATSKLRQGQTVKVLREQNGWLAIEPPPGSFDWIDEKHVEINGNIATVKVDNVDVIIGSMFVDQQPNARGEKQRKGAQLVLLGRTIPAGGVNLLSIQPPPQEVRWIPREAVAIAPQVQAAVAPVAATMTPPPATPPANLASNSSPLWLQAEQAEREGKQVLAYSLYKQIADQTTDSDLRFRALNRMQTLLGSQAPAPGGVTLADNRGFSNPTAAPNQPARALSQYGAPAAPQQGYPAPAMPPMTAALTGQGGYPPTATPVGNLPLQRSGPGYLVRTSQKIQGQPAYGLLDSRNNFLMYVTPPAKYSLDQYVNRNVDVLGTTIYDNQLRKNHMTAQHVYLLD